VNPLLNIGHWPVDGRIAGHIHIEHGSLIIDSRRRTGPTMRGGVGTRCNHAGVPSGRRIRAIHRNENPIRRAQRHSIPRVIGVKSVVLARFCFGRSSAYYKRCKGDSDIWEVPAWSKTFAARMVPVVRRIDSGTCRRWN